MHFHIHKDLQDAAIWTWPSSNKSQHCWTLLIFWCGEHLCKIMIWYWQFLQSYRVHKVAWPCAFESSKRSHKDFYVENFHIKLQHDTGNLRRVITFTRFRTPPTHPGNDNSLRGWGVKMSTQDSIPSFQLPGGPECCKCTDSIPNERSQMSWVICCHGKTNT